MKNKKFGMIFALAAAMMTLTSSSAFAQLQNFPAPFVGNGSANTYIVVGATAAPSDVVGAIDIAMRLGGLVTTNVSVSGTAGGISISGEGKELSTTNTKIYLNDTMGKTGLRSTLTADDMPTLLASGTLEDSTEGTTHNYQQFIYMTPSDTSCTTANEAFCLQFDKPSGSSTTDPTYNFGTFTTSPSTSNYLYRTYVTFDRDVNGTSAVGEKLNLFGNSYTIASGTDFSSTPAKLVLFGGAQNQVVKGGQSMTVNIGAASYTLTLIGDSDATHAVVGIGSDIQTIEKGTSRQVGGVDVYVDDVFFLSSTDQTQNAAKLLIGSQKLTLQDGSKVMVGNSQDTVDGSLAKLTTSEGRLSALTVYTGAASSDLDFLAAGGTYADPVWKTFSIAFPGVTPSMNSSSRDTISISPAGTNNMQLTFTDDRGNTKTINWADKASSSGTTFGLADSSSNPFVVVEGQPIKQDNYFVLDSGDFTHIYQLTGTSIDGTSSSNIEITDIMTGVSSKITLGPDNKATKVIDGQTYYFNTTGTDTVHVTWGAGSSDGNPGSYITVWPRLKAQNNEFLSFANASYTPQITISSGEKLQLPTGAILLTQTSAHTYTISAASKEDGTATSTGGTTTIDLSAESSANATFSVGRTTSGQVWYDIKAAGTADTLKIGVVGAQQGSAVIANPTIMLVEQPDSNNNQNAVIVAAQSESSGSDQAAIAGEPQFTWGAPTAQSSTLGSDSTITDYVDLWGTWVRRTTSGQDSVSIHYPDQQVIAQIAVVSNGVTASISTSGSGSTIPTPVPVKTPVGKIDNELTSADEQNHNLILVGGPLVNTPVAQLATAGKTRNAQFYLSQGAGYYLIDYIANAFGGGHDALVVAGYAKEETRLASTKLQNFDSAGLSGSRMEFKNGVLVSLGA